MTARLLRGAPVAKRIRHEVELSAQSLRGETGISPTLATVLIGTWVKEIDRERVGRVLAGDQPFDEASLADGGHGAHEGEREVRGAQVVAPTAEADAVHQPPVRS